MVACFSHLFLFLTHDVHGSTGYIDLSKRRVSPEEAIKCEDKFTKSKTVSVFCLFIAKYILNTVSYINTLHKCTLQDGKRRDEMNKKLYVEKEIHVVQLYIYFISLGIRSFILFFPQVFFRRQTLNCH